MPRRMKRKTQNSNTLARRSDKAKKVLSSSIGFKQAPEINGPPHFKRKKEKCLSRVTMESGKVELDMEEESGLKRSKLTGRDYKSIYTKQHKGTTTVLEPCFEHPHVLGICVLCTKNRRIGYDSPEQELCTCYPSANKHAARFFAIRDRSDHGVDTTEKYEKWNSAPIPLEIHDDCQNLCALCNTDGELLFCKGKGCKRSYHRCCLDPAVIDSLPGVWHCPQCVKKKRLFGVHSVSDGVESIVDVREVDSHTKGVRQLQYFVKYFGLAHIHNHWVPKDRLLLENPCLVSTFIENDQVMKWNVEWRIPQRLLSKRPIQDKIFIGSSTDIYVCNYEWLVKWHGLNYDHATWELESEPLLMSSLGQKLMEEYKSRHQRARQEVSKCEGELAVKLSKLPGSRSQLNDSSLLKNVNKLRDFLLKSQNAVVFDDQHRTAMVIFLIQSMKETRRPFLVVTASSSFPTWEAEFAQMVPSVDFVVYNGTKDARKGIIASEFYEGYVTLEVLLSSPEAVLEDVEILKSTRWEAIVIDDYPKSGILDNPDQIRVLCAGSSILLFTDQIKDMTPDDYRRILSLLECHDDFGKLMGVEYKSNGSLSKLKDRLSQFIAYSNTSSLSRFLEYWVPVQISNYQLEQYCASLLCDATALCSCSKNDSVGVLRNILMTARKCCDHPYILDLSMQERLTAGKRPDEILDIGIKVSGKLQILDTMLEEIKNQGLKVLILYQTIVSEGPSMGDILDDFVRQRFGQSSYERVDARILSSKKQAAVNRFNKKETGQFVFLLENRACSSAIKFSSIDIVIVYDSDWNPANDLRALQKISVPSKDEQIKVFRLYSSFTVEERALVLAKQKLNFDYNMQNISRTATDTLLSWGSLQLFEKLDDYHTDSRTGTTSDFSSEQSLLLMNEVIKEFRGILSNSCENNDLDSVISRVQFGIGGYTSTTATIGEAIVQLKDGEEFHIFWRNLFNGKSPQWKHLPKDYPRNRKRIHYLDKSSYGAITEKNDVHMKRRKIAAENSDPKIVQVESGAQQLTQLSGSMGVEVCNQSENFQKVSTNSEDKPDYLSGANLLGAGDFVGESEERSIVSDREGLHRSLQVELTRLCQTLKLSEDTTTEVGTLLDYVLKNHRVTGDSPSLLHAFQISICWIAASITKKQVNKKDSLMCAKKLLDYQCTEEQANLVYSKMRSLQRSYMLCSGNKYDSMGDHLSAEDLRKEQLNVNKIKSLEVESKNQSPDEKYTREQVRDDNDDGSETDAKIKMLQHECDKRMDELTQKHKEEIQEFHRMWEEERLEMDRKHKVDSAFVRSVHDQGSIQKMRNNLDLLESRFADKMELHNLHKDRRLKELQAKQLAAVQEERQNALYLLGKDKSASTELAAVQPVFLREDFPSDATKSVPNEVVPHACSVESSNASETLSISEKEPTHEEEHSDEIQPVVQKDDFRTEAAMSIPNEVVWQTCSVEPSNASETGSEKECDTVLPDDLVRPRDGPEAAIVVLQGPTHNLAISENVPTHVEVEQHSDEIQPAVQKDDSPTESEAAKFVPNEVRHACSVESSNASETGSGKECDAALPDDLVRLGDEPEEASVILQRLEQHLVHSRPTVAMHDCSESLPEQVKEQSSAELQLPETPRALGLSDDVVIMPPNLAVPLVDDNVIHLSANDEALPIENMEHLHSVSVQASIGHPSPANDPDSGRSSVQVESSLSQNPFPATDDQGRILPQTTESGRTGAISGESCSPRRGNIGVFHTQPDMQPACYATLGQNVEMSSISQSNVSLHQTMTSRGWQNQAVPPIGISFSNSHVPNINISNHHDLQPSRMSAPSWPADPLLNEIEKIRKEIEDLKRNRENMITIIKSDCEKEIQENVAEIRKKYEMKQQDTEAEFKLKEDELSKNKNTLLKNIMLSQALRRKCLPHPTQGIPSTSMQQPHPMSMPPSHVQPPATSARPPSFPRQQQITPRPVQSMQNIPGTLSGRSSFTKQSGTPPPPQVVQHPTALFSSTSSRPPIIGTITPGEIRSQPRHLQPIRLPSLRVTTPATSSAVTQLQPPQIRLSGVQSFRHTAPPVSPVTSSATQLQPAQMPPSVHVQSPNLQPNISNFASENRPSTPRMRPSWTLKPTLPPGQRPPSINMVSVNRPESQGGVPAATQPPSSGGTTSTDHRPSMS